MSVVNFCAPSDGQEKQTSGNRVERPAMADLFYFELAAHECDHVVRSHALGFVHEQDAVRSGA